MRDRDQVRRMGIIAAIIMCAALALVLRSTERSDSAAGDAGAADRTAATTAGPADPTDAAAPDDDAPVGTGARAAATAGGQAAGMVVAVDPETGQLGMPEHAAGGALTIEALQALAAAEAQGLVTVRHPDGSESIAHEGRFMTFTVVRAGADGALVFDCGQGRHALPHALRHVRARAEER